MNYLEIDGDGIAIEGVYTSVEGVEIPASWRPITPTGPESIGYRWNSISSEWEAPLVSVNELREQRDAVILETDWWAVQDRTMLSGETTYRQALRDITNDYVPVESPVWPVNPHGTEEP